MNKKTTNILLTFAFIGTMAVLYYTIGISPTYYICDDIFMKQIVSGEMLGVPEEHILHIGYLTGSFLKILYTLFPTVPWYGILLFSYYGISIIIIYYTLIKGIDSLKVKLLFFILFAFITISFLWIHMILIQFTTITAILCAVSLITFYVSEDCFVPFKYVKSNAVSLLFFFLSFELRNAACLMFLPTFFFLALAKLLKNKKMFVPLVSYGCSLICIMSACVIIENLAYSEDQWKDFRTYNNARAQIVDYNGFLDYEDYASHYEAHGIDYTSYQAIVSHAQLLLDENIDTPFMIETAALSYHPHINIPSMIKQFLELHTTSYHDRPLNLIVYLLYIFTFFLIILSKRTSAFCELLALLAGRMSIWFYLLYINRPQPRVTQGIYFVELILLAAILLKNNLWAPIINRPKIVYWVTLSCFIGSIFFFGAKWGLPFMKGTHNTSTGRIYLYQNYREIQSYFNEHEENLYLLDTNNFCNFLEPIFEPSGSSMHNSILLGSWTSNSPWTDYIAENYQITSFETAALTMDNVFFVFFDSGTKEYDYLEQYYQSKYPNSAIRVHDSFKTSMGLEILILKVENTAPF